MRVKNIVYVLLCVFPCLFHFSLHVSVLMSFFLTLVSSRPRLSVLISIYHCICFSVDGDLSRPWLTLAQPPPPLCSLWWWRSLCCDTDARVCRQHRLTPESQASGKRKQTDRRRVSKTLYIDTCDCCFAVLTSTFVCFVWNETVALLRCQRGSAWKRRYYMFWCLIVFLSSSNMRKDTNGALRGLSSDIQPWRLILLLEGNNLPYLFQVERTGGDAHVGRPL